MKTVKELKKGEFFTKKDIMFPKESQVFIRGDYDRSLKKYECIRFSDICSYSYLKSDSIVFTDFCF